MFDIPIVPRSATLFAQSNQQFDSKAMAEGA
jgi:hypothetical protein